MRKNILFDFDGTIVDTSEGIIKSMNYAFEKLGKTLLTDIEIKEMIGPPLEIMLERLLNTSNKETIDKGVYYFRERYKTQGLEELYLYPGVKETLEDLRKLGINLFIVTSKPQVFTYSICENLEITQYFKDVSGVQLNCKSKSKSERVGEIIKKHNLNDVVMVGDREEDVIAALENNIETIGVTYGFGKKIDLKEAGCKYFCDRFKDIIDYCYRAKA